MKVTVNDRISFAITRREYTDEGFLRVPGRVARTGKQEYLARELGLTDRAPDDIVIVYRPADEVFAKSSLDSYASADITVDHPPVMVDAGSYRQYSVGTVNGPGRPDGDFVECDLIIKAKDGIDAAESGRSQLSAGYTAIYDDDVPEGADYDFIQRDIKINHVALVERARAGAQARISDHHPSKGEPMTVKVVLDSASGRSIEVADEATAALVNDTLERHRQAAKDASDRAEAAEAARDSALEERDEARRAASDEAIAERVATISTVKDRAAKVAGKGFSCDSLDPVTIQRAALAVRRPSVDWAAKGEAYVQAAFDMEEEKVEDEDEEGEEGEKKGTGDSARRGEQYRQLSADAARQESNDLTKVRDSAMGRLSGAWKTTVGEE